MIYVLVSIHGILVSVHGILVSVHGILVSVHGILVSVHGILVSVHGILVPWLYTYTCFLSMTGMFMTPSGWERSCLMKSSRI